ncbi:phosphoinositide 3-kinase adapter protein 1 [Plakobranchus ocellatus]|uniref:Phosphoinositide 3-kinase adapter protein 1 n=1 Tax=Plakobranchus ocellatus TaxID=259542 RepID=A0AAV4CJT1_9GAST|nr:phosphoinositide 3-kinase adapter protein 1 [Plakobranchus ocellatus]
MSATTFRDVTLMYAIEDKNWCDYVLKFFRNDKMKLWLETLPLKMEDWKNPPEIEVAVKESHVLMLLTTSNLLNYMEEKKDWFSSMLKKGDPGMSTVVYVRLDTPSDVMDEFCEEHLYHYDDSNSLEICDSGSNITDVITNIMQLVESNSSKAKHEVPATRPKRASETKTLSVEIIPECFHQTGERVSLIFKEAIQGEVTVTFRKIKDEIRCELINPYCAIFRVPELSEKTVYMQIHVNGVGKRKLKIENNVLKYEYSSAELLFQTYGASSREELDVMLASQLTNSLCSDPLAMRLFDSPPEKPGSFETNHDQYPTILHWAAAYGFKELTSALLSAPGATQACDTINADGLDPQDLARKNGYPELSDLIDEFIEMDNACDLYIQFANLKREPTEEIGGDYEEMTFNPTAISAFVGQPASMMGKVDENTAAPPLPPRSYRRDSSDKGLPGDLPSPKDFFTNDPQPALAIGSLGSRSQTELIEIQEGVKKGDFSINQAEMLLRSWKERNQTGNAMSFKDRQQNLEVLKKQLGKDMKAWMKLNCKKKKTKLSPTAEEKTECISISDPILKRSNRQVPGIGRGDSTNSNISFQSVDSGRDSLVSTFSQVSTSSDECEYLYPTSYPIPETRSHLEPGSSAGEHNRAQSKPLTHYQPSEIGDRKPIPLSRSYSQDHSKQQKGTHHMHGFSRNRSMSLQVWHPIITSSFPSAFYLSQTITNAVLPIF